MKSIINKIWNSKAWLLITTGALLLVNWLGSIYHTRIDLTNEKRFTLSTPTKKIIKQLDDQVIITIFCVIPVLAALFLNLPHINKAINRKYVVSSGRQA